MDVCLLSPFFVCVYGVCISSVKRNHVSGRLLLSVTNFPAGAAYLWSSTTSSLNWSKWLIQPDCCSCCFCVCVFSSCGMEWNQRDTKCTGGHFAHFLLVLMLTWADANEQLTCWPASYLKQIFTILCTPSQDSKICLWALKKITGRCVVAMLNYKHSWECESCRLWPAID